MSRFKGVLSYLSARWERVVGAAFLLFLLFGNQGFRSLLNNWLELRHLRRDIVELEKQEASIEHKVQSLQSGGDIPLERMARKELGLIKKGEIEYRFPPPK